MSAAPGSAARLDPFALPSETSQRFRLLLLVATLAAYSSGTLWVYRFGPADPPLDALASAGLAAAALLWVGALVMFAVHQLHLPRLHGGLLPPGADDLLTARLAALGVGTSPRVLVGRDVRSAAALAYGFPWSPRILLGGALRVFLRRDPGGFDAVVRHELAHHQNRDVGKVHVARAVFWTLVVLAGLNACAWLVASVADGDPADPALVQLGSLLPELVSPAVFLAVAYADYAGLLRVREHYADWRAAQHGVRGDLRRLLAGSAPAAAAPLRRFLRLHPTAADRLEALDHPERVGRLAPGPMVSIGVTGAFVLCAWLDLVQDLETTGHVDTAPWEIGGVDQMMSDFVSTPTLTTTFLLLTMMLLAWGVSVATAAQRYWACRAVAEWSLGHRGNLLRAVAWAGLGVGLGSVVWPTQIYSLDLGDGAAIGWYLLGPLVVAPIGLAVVSLLFLVVRPLVAWNLRIFRRQRTPAWFSGLTSILAWYLLGQAIQLAMLVGGLSDAGSDVVVGVLTSAVVAVACWRALAAIASRRRGSALPVAPTAGPPSWLLAPADR